MGLPTSLRSLLTGTRPWASQPAVPWREARLCVVDIETTGLNLARDEIVSVGVAEIVQGRITSNTWYRTARPAGPISPEAMCVHCLTPAELASAPPAVDVLKELKEWVSGSVIVAHAAWVERTFLNRQLKPLGERVPDRLVDTAALARALDVAPRSQREPSLEGLARQLGLPVYTPHHALSDAMTTALVLLAMVSRREASTGTQFTVERLYGLSDGDSF